jgi:hypothetical protein
LGSGKENGEGGGQYASNLGPEWTGIAPHAKEGFRNREGIFQAKGDYQRDCPGVIKGIVPCACGIISILYISC